MIPATTSTAANQIDPVYRSLGLIDAGIQGIRLLSSSVVSALRVGEEN